MKKISIERYISEKEREEKEMMKIKVISNKKSFYDLLVEEAKKNTKTNSSGLTTISEEDPDFYDTIWDEEDVKTLNESESEEPKAKEIWKVSYPFEEGEGSKERPVLVLDINKSSAKILSMKITSNIKRYFSDNPDNWDVPLNDYRFEGLNEPSVVRIDKVIEIDTSQFKSKYGKISERDWKKVYSKFEEFKNK